MLLSNEAKRIITEFEDRVRALSADERDDVLKRLTSHINTLNEEAAGLLHTLQSARAGTEEALEERLDQIEDEIRDYK
jgi:acyl-CoA reductase-like NAD-dependent aldehyde dehydrogenase